MSFLEMFDVLNDRLISKDEEPVAFDNDCREGIYGMCSMYINGEPHGTVECPKIISHETIVRLNHEYLVATL